MVVDLKKGVLVQKCLDFDCRSLNFKGNELSLSPSLLSDLPLSLFPLINQSIPSSVDNNNNNNNINNNLDNNLNNITEEKLSNTKDYYEEISDEMLIDQVELNPSQFP